MRGWVCSPRTRCPRRPGGAGRARSGLCHWSMWAWHWAPWCWVLDTVFRWLEQQPAWRRLISKHGGQWKSHCTYLLSTLLDTHYTMYLNGHSTVEHKSLRNFGWHKFIIDLQDNLYDMPIQLSIKVFFIYSKQAYVMLCSYEYARWLDWDEFLLYYLNTINNVKYRNWY